MIDGMHAAGMATCGKHFPGHGWANADSHKELPEDTRFQAEIIGQDAKPYAWLGSALDSVMTAHVMYPDVDAIPATFSSRWLQDVLREKCGFQGVIFSDDLAMGGALGLGGIVQRAEAALRAGCDALRRQTTSSRGSSGRRRRSSRPALPASRRGARSSRWSRFRVTRFTLTRKSGFPRPTRISSTGKNKSGPRR